MALSDWLIIGAFTIFAKKEIEKEEEKREQVRWKYAQDNSDLFELKSNWSRLDVESARKEDVNEKRQATPCKFMDGITYEDFEKIAQKAGDCIKRIKKVSIHGAVIYCTVESQTGYSDWNFFVDFNDWGHITGTYWICSENFDSNIPQCFGNKVSGNIQQILWDRRICLPKYYEYVNDNKDLGTPSGLSYFEKGCKKNWRGNAFIHEQKIASKFDSQALLGEHIYLVISMLKSNGFNNIKSIPIKDVGQKSKKYIFEVEQVVINGISFFEIGDLFAESSTVIITYHAKQEITVPYSLNYFKKKNYITVGKQLQDMGFSNIYKREINDLVTGLVKKDGSVNQVLVNINRKEMPMHKNQVYDFDTEIVITYHAFSKSR